MARSALAGLIFGCTLLVAQPPQQDSFQQAGVCARCHVVQVLEWSASKHTRTATTCQACHGASEGHVANERNQVKPDRLPQEPAAIASLCATCHLQGCPKTKKEAECQTCHHSHALANPDVRQMRPTAVPTVDPRFRQRMDEGERQVKLRNWRAARDAFSEAVRMVPADRTAASRLRMAERRLNPAMPGFEIVGDGFDPQSGLPLQVRVQGIGIEMILVPARDAEIGSDSWPNARPVHSVRLQPFYLAKFELTQQQWSQLQVEDPSPQKGSQLPVHGISWNDAQQWIARLNDRVAGSPFRLPSEAEWESAASPDERPLSDRAWFRENSASAPKGPFRESSDYALHAVGQKLPNAAGFFDLQGNVAEWCSSLIQPYPYSGRDGRESRDGDGLRAIRGGSFVDSSEFLHPSFRHSDRPSRRNRWTGMRLARSASDSGYSTAGR